MNLRDRHKRNELPWGLEITQFIFLLLAIVMTVLTLIGIFGAIFITDYLNSERTLKLISIAFYAVVFCVLFYGTFKIKRWAVALVLFFSAVGFFNHFIYVLTIKPTTTIELTQKIFSLLMATFFLFQLYIFTRPKTKEFFKEKGTTLVS